jgi:hypothetical protein
MARIFGFAVGAIWLVFTGIAFMRSMNGFGANQTDVGFWWAFIGSFLALAAASAIGGTIIHTRER